MLIKRKDMSKKTPLIVAGTFGIAIAFALILLRNYIIKNEYEQEYGDFHRNFK